MRVYIYTRVSSDDQVDGFSLKQQIDACQNFAKAREWDVVEIFVEEGESAFRDGLKRPRLREMFGRVKSDGVERIIGLPLAPHYSQMSIDGYRSSVEEGVRSLTHPLPVRFVESWHGNPLFVAALVKNVRKALQRFEKADAADVEVVFSAHSLPRRILQWDDPYPRELRQSCEAVAEAARLPSWRFAYQSASHTGEPWLGPDILETLGDLASQGEKRVLLVPIGFVSDNLEILFDIDLEAQELAQGLGMELRRTEMPNASPAFIDALADLVVNGTGARISESAG